MRKFLSLLSVGLALSFCIPFIASASAVDYGNTCWLASGFSNPDFDGTLVADGTNDGVTSYSLTATSTKVYLTSITGGSYWIFDYVKGNTGPTWYYREGNVIYGTYNVDSHGGTAGSVNPTDCPGGGGSWTDPFEQIFGFGTTTTTTASYIIEDNPTQDLFMLYLAFLLTAGGVIWYFKRA